MKNVQLKDIKSIKGIYSMKQAAYIKALQELKEDMTLPNLANGTFRNKVFAVAKRFKISSQKVYKDIDFWAMNWGGNK